jgi:hypothetical protein
MRRQYFLEMLPLEFPSFQLLPPGLVSVGKEESKIKKSVKNKNKEKGWFMEDLIKFEDLMKLLGYSDERSVKKWCRKRSIPIIPMGLNKYILSHFLTQHIDNQLVIFDKVNLVDSFEVFKGIKKVKEIEAQKTSLEKKDGIKKEKRSAVAMKFLNKIKPK